MEHDQKSLPFDGEFYLWDYRYYDRKFIEQSLSLDDSLVKEYFPVSKVVPAILEIYQNLLGVKFVEVKGETWHPGKLIFTDSSWDHQSHPSRRCPDVLGLGEGRQGRIRLRWVLLPRSLPSWYVRIPSSLLLHPLNMPLNSIEVLPRRGLAAAPGVRQGGRDALVPAHGDGREPREADAREARADAARRRRHLLPRDGPRLPRAALAHQVLALPRHERRGRLRRGAVADVGELVLRAEGARADEQPLREWEAARRGADRQDHQEVGRAFSCLCDVVDGVAAGMRV